MTSTHVEARSEWRGLRHMRPNILCNCETLRDHRKQSRVSPPGNLLGMFGTHQSPGFFATAGDNYIMLGIVDKLMVTADINHLCVAFGGAVDHHIARTMAAVAAVTIVDHDHCILIAVHVCNPDCTVGWSGRADNAASHVDKLLFLLHVAL
jgi:hypothetical protein